MIKKMSALQKTSAIFAIVVIIFNIALYFRHVAYDTVANYPLWSGVTWVLIFAALALPVVEPKLPQLFRIRTLLIVLALAIACFQLGRVF